MKSWIHEIAESYVAGHKPVRRDLKENYVKLNEEQRFGLLSENVLVYLDEQLQNAFGFGVFDLTEEELNTIFANLYETFLNEEEKQTTSDPSPETPPVEQTPAPKTIEITLSGNRHQVPEGHIVAVLKTGGVLTGPPGHVLAGAGSQPIKRIYDPWGVKK